MRASEKISMVVALAAIVAVAAPASATLVPGALGSDMAGGKLTVTFQAGGPVPGLIVAGPAAEEGSVTMAGLFSFSVIGSTNHNRWTLTNLTKSDFILVADFNLPPSLSLFDDDSTPSTPNSLDGRAGVAYISGPVEFFSGEYQPWPNAQNKGDMYEGEKIQWDESTFGPGMTYAWMDDTDPIPEPVTLALLFGGGVPVLLRRRRK